MQKILKNKNNCLIIAGIVASFLYLSNATSAVTSHFSSNNAYQVCFTPMQDCTQLIVDNIENAKQSIYVQAYSFTSAPIAFALVNAKRKGINVKVILDKSQIRAKAYSSAKYLMNNQIETWIDYRPAIAHNKVMIIDKDKVITGSFNFTKAAQKRNAENLIVFNDEVLSEKYLNNWLARREQSVSAKEYMYLHRRRDEI